MSNDPNFIMQLLLMKFHERRGESIDVIRLTFAKQIKFVFTHPTGCDLEGERKRKRKRGKEKKGGGRMCVCVCVREREREKERERESGCHIKSQKGIERK